MKGPLPCSCSCPVQLSLELRRQLTESKRNSCAPAFSDRPCGVLSSVSPPPGPARPSTRAQLCRWPGLLHPINESVRAANAGPSRHAGCGWKWCAPCRASALLPRPLARLLRQSVECPWPSRAGSLFGLLNPQPLIPGPHTRCAEVPPEAPSRLFSPPAWRKEDMLCRDACRRTRHTKLPRREIWTRSGGRCSRPITLRSRSGTKTRCAAHHAHEASMQSE